MRATTMLAVAAGLLLLSGSAEAQGNYQSERLSGASFILGGTGVALGADPLITMMNPARIPHVTPGSLYLSRVIHGRIEQLNNYHSPDGSASAPSTEFEVGNADVDVFDIDLLLGGLCYVEDFGTGPGYQRDDPWGINGHAGHHQFALCVALSDQEQLTATAQQAHLGKPARLHSSGTLVAEFSRRQLGLGWGWHITDELSVGLGGFVAISRYHEALSGSSLLAETAERDLLLTSMQLDASGLSIDIVPNAGLSYRAGEHVTLGAAIRIPSIHAYGDWSRSLLRASSAGSFVRTTERGEFATNMPARLALGVGVHTESVRAELSGYYHFAHDELFAADIEDSSHTVVGDVPRAFDKAPPELRSEKADPVANLGVGLEWRVIDPVGLMAGVTTDWSALRPIAESADDRLLFRRIDRWHFSGGLAFYGTLGQLLFGARFTVGDGEIRTFDPTAATPDVGIARDQEYAFLFTITGSTHLRAIASWLSDDDEPTPP